MTNTQTKRINHYYLGTLTVLAMVAAALLLTATLSYAAGTTFTVDSTLDASDVIQADNICDADVSSARVCTLRAAIEEANSNNDPAVVDRIDFDIPGPGVHTISPGSALPTITEPVIVDGYTQPGASPNTKAVGNDAALKIELNGTNAPSADGLRIADADTGANNLQNKPVLSSARNASGKTAIKGGLSSNANQTFTIEFYANPADTNEAKIFIGEKTVTATVDGLASFTFTPATRVAAGQTITATATNTSTHDTSEFSAPRTVVSS
jgi:hypothetical protein